MPYLTYYIALHVLHWRRLFYYILLSSRIFFSNAHTYLEKVRKPFLVTNVTIDSYAVSSNLSQRCVGSTCAANKFNVLEKYLSCKKRFRVLICLKLWKVKFVLNSALVMCLLFQRWKYLGSLRMVP